MKQITTKPIEPLNEIRHKFILMSCEVAPWSCAISGVDLPKVIYSPNFKAKTQGPMHTFEKFACLEQADFKLYSLTQEEFRDLCVMFVCSLTELEFADNYKTWLQAKQKDKQEITSQMKKY